MNMCIVWMVIAAISAVVEVATVAVAAIWFVLGAVVAMLASLFGAHFWTQICVFILVSTLGFFAFRKIWSSSRVPSSHTNFDRNIGRAVKVIEAIDNLAGTGAVKMNGQYWSAKSEAEGTEIPVGAKVTVKRFEGSKVIVALEQVESQEKL